MPKVYLNDRGDPVSTKAPAYLGDDGEPAADPITRPTPHELNLHTPQTISEPTTYAGGFWKGLKDYGKDLISDPTTMASVGSGLALATTPVTGPWGLAAAGALGAAGGAGGAHIVKQLRAGPENASDVLGSMATQGAVGGALTAVPPLAGKAGRYLVDRAGRLAAPEAAPVVDQLAHAVLRRHGPATIAGTVGGWLGGHEGAALASGAVEAAQSPVVNRVAGRALEGVGEIPDAMRSLMGRVSGSGRAAELEAAASARQPGLNRALGIGREAPAEMTPWSGFDAGGSAGAPAIAEDAQPMRPWSAFEEATTPTKPHLRAGTLEPLPYGPGESTWPAPAAAADDLRPPLEYRELPPSRRLEGVAPADISDTRFEELMQKFGGKQMPPSMAALEAGPLESGATDVAPIAVLGRDAFNARFHQQLLDSLARAR